MARRKQYRISPEVASARGRAGARGRNSPTGYIGCVEAAIERGELTPEHKRRLIKLVLGLLDTDFGGEASGEHDDAA